MPAVKPLYFTISYLLSLMASVKVFFFFINHPNECTSINSELLVDEFGLLTGDRERGCKTPPEAKLIYFEERKRIEGSHIYLYHMCTQTYINRHSEKRKRVAHLC